MRAGRRQQDSRSRQQEEALARSVLYAALGSALQRPEACWLGRWLTPEGRHTMGLAAEVVDPAGSALRAAVMRPEDAGSPDIATLRERYDVLFGHTARGPICAFETEYGADDLFRQPQELAHLGGYYEAFGVRPRRDGERVDHIASECEFMALLAGREACLLGLQSPDGLDAEEAAAQLETTRAAERGFLRDHLGRFGAAFGGRLARADADGFFGGVARVLLAFLELEAELLDVALGPATLDLRPPAMDATPMGCGNCPELTSLDPRAGEEP
jgi:TorA maturation chaperone TorD